MYCDFKKGLRPVSRLNLVSHALSILPPDQSIHVLDDRGRIFAAVRESGSWHNHYPGDPRIELDLSRLVSFYDTALVPSLIPSRINQTRFSHRLANISSEDTHAVMRAIDEALSNPCTGSGVDWRTLFQVITLRYADRLELLQHHLNASDTETASRTPSEVAAHVLHELRIMLAPYILHSATPIPRHPTSNTWASPVFQHCATTHTDFITSISSTLTSSERLLLKTIRGTNREICRVVVKIWAEAVLEGLDPALPPSAASPDTDEKRLSDALARWRADIQRLMDWLSWSVWIKCRPACSFEVHVSALMRLNYCSKPRHCRKCAIYRLGHSSVRRKMNILVVEALVLQHMMMKSFRNLDVCVVLHLMA
ncbi:hypothetical protein H0H87_006615 [Tephrocybe sp. NHM501043]|nr:hypothetical protein H0H87_006615 [Tephrocybe sp. NHM501043]